MMFTKVLIFLAFIWMVNADCPYFEAKYNEAKALERNRKDKNKVLERSEFVQDDDDLGYERTEIVPCRNGTGISRWYENCAADLYTATASLIADSSPETLANFESFAQCLGKKPRQATSRPKYRTINGYSNNLKNPFWGSTGAPYGRFGPKNYADGVFAPRKSVSGNDLPNPRKLSQNILMKAEIKTRKGKIPNDMSNFAGLYITHDIAAIGNEKLPTDKCEDMRCCFRENAGVLPPPLQNSACFPIPISEDDPFYSQHEVKCLNFIRSEKSSLPSNLQFGEIKNKATGFLDLSLVYGNEESDTKTVRTYSGGKLRVNSKNLMAVDDSDDYSPISDRMRATPATSIWPTLFTRNHNKLADQLAAINPLWKDEKLFQEARRINIAILQSITLDYVNFLFEPQGGYNLNNPYDENVDVASTVEFHSAAYRYFHFYVNSDIPIVQNDGTASSVKFSDIFGKLKTIEDNFDAVINGLFAQSINLGVYSDELVNHFSKRHDDGVGVDVVSFDIQRGRDHGVPTYLQARQQCGLSYDFTSFEDLLEIFPQSYVDLLRAEYESVEDIDLIIGGSLESFQKLENDVVGETFDCIMKEQYKRVFSGDAYFFLNPASPYPFTAAQIEAIRGVSLNHLVCLNTAVESVPSSTYYVPSVDNPKVPCSSLNQINLSAWKNV